MAIIETEVWKKDPERNGVLVFDSQRKAQDVFDDLKAHLKADGRLPDEYFSFDSRGVWGNGALFPKDGEILCNVNYGGSEGIYIDISVKHHVGMTEDEKRNAPPGQTHKSVIEHFATGKTLGDSIDDLDKMNLVAASVMAAFYGSEREVKERYAQIENGEAEIVYPTEAQRRIYEAITAKSEQKPKTGQEEKRNIEGYEEKLCIEIAGRYVVLAENPDAPMPYLVCDISYNNILRLEERHNPIVSDDFLEAMRDFVDHVDTLLATLEKERLESGLPLQKLTAAECLPGSLNADWEGKLLIIKPEILAPEYRSAEHQLVECTGGFGARANARGTKVFARDLFGKKECYYYRDQIAGIADLSKLPEWAMKIIKENELPQQSEAPQQANGDVKQQSETPQQAKDGVKPESKKPATLQEKLGDAKKKAADENATRKDGQSNKPNKHKETEVK